MVQTVEDFLVGTVELGAGIVVYKVGQEGLMISEATGYKPDWLKYCEDEYNKDNKMIEAILEDPSLLVEGIAQQVSDSYEKDGLAYCSGYTIGLVAQTVLLRKVKFGKAGELGKIDELSKLDEGIGVSEASKGSSFLDKLNELRNSLPDKHQTVDSYGNKVVNVAYSTSDINGYNIDELKSFSKYGSKGKNGIKNPVD